MVFTKLEDASAERLKKAEKTLNLPFTKNQDIYERAKEKAKQKEREQKMLHEPEIKNIKKRDKEKTINEIKKKLEINKKIRNDTSLDNKRKSDGIKESKKESATSTGKLKVIPINKAERRMSQEVEMVLQLSPYRKPTLPAMSDKNDSALIDSGYQRGKGTEAEPDFRSSSIRKKVFVTDQEGEQDMDEY